MQPAEPESDLTPRLVEALYAEAMLLADEVRAYFDEGGREDRDRLDATGKVAFACESLRVTTRLMHVLAWLLTRKAVYAGELGPDDAREPRRRLGEAADSDDAELRRLPLRARMLIAQSRDLYGRVSRLDEESAREREGASPARSLLGRLEQSF